MQYSPTVFHHVTARVEVCNNVITSSSSATLKNRQKNSFCFLRTREKVSVKAIFLFLFFQERAFFLLSKSYVPLQLYEKNLAFLFFYLLCFCLLTTTTTTYLSHHIHSPSLSSKLQVWVMDKINVWLYVNRKRKFNFQTLPETTFFFDFVFFSFRQLNETFFRFISLIMPF